MRLMRLLGSGDTTHGPTEMLRGFGFSSQMISRTAFFMTQSY
jgi:hypothetical protein